MENRTPAGALDGLRVLTPPDLARIQHAFTVSEVLGWGHYFPYLLARQKPGRTEVLLAEDGGSLCVFQRTNREKQPRVELLFPPLPLQAPVLRRCLERANEFNGDRSARVLRVDERDAAAVTAAGSFRVKQRRSQYLFAPAEYQELGGRRFRTLRRQIALLEDQGLEVVTYRPEHAAACRALLREWRKHHRETQGTAGGAGTTARALDLLGTLEERVLRCELIFRGETLVAFALGGEIRPGLACFFDAKSDPSIRGLSYFQRWSFLRGLTGFDLVNDGSDTGRAGLRQLKDSMRPVRMHAEFRATQKD